MTEDGIDALYNECAHGIESGQVDAALVALRQIAARHYVMAHRLASWTHTEIDPSMEQVNEFSRDI